MSSYSPIDHVVSRQVQEELDRIPDHFARMAAFYDAQHPAQPCYVCGASDGDLCQARGGQIAECPR